MTTEHERDERDGRAEREERAAVVSRVLSGSPEEVYDEWLDEEGMAEWMCPRPARPTRIEIDGRVGGRYRIDIDDEGFELSITGEYLELDRPHRLRFTWDCTTWEAGAPPSTVTVTLEPDGTGRTVMTIRHEQLPADVVDDHRNGWSRIGEQFEGYLTSRISPR